MLINENENTDLNHLSNFKAFIEYLNDMDNILKSLEEYNPNKKCKIFIGFVEIIADMLSNKS